MSDVVKKKNDRTFDRFEFTQKIYLKRGKIVETPETLSPRYPLRRRKTSTRHRRISRQQPPLNVNIYHVNRVERFVSPPHQWTPFKKQTGLNTKCKNLEFTEELLEDSARSRTIICTNKRATNQRSHKCIEEEGAWREQCSRIEIAASKPMDHHPE